MVQESYFLNHFFFCPTITWQERKLFFFLDERRQVFVRVLPFVYDDGNITTRHEAIFILTTSAIILLGGSLHL